MLDFNAVRAGQVTIGELVEGLTRDDLADLTDEMIDAMLDRIQGCVDEDVTFEPVDPAAHDPYAIDPADVDLAWNLGHVIVHVTASAEESAFLAAELARGVENHGRSRFEVSWQSMTSMAVCHQRLEESRRMRVGSLDMWPEPAFLDNGYQPWEGAPEVNAVGRFVLGLMHDDSHLEQLAEIVRQAKEARS
jgi:hypothetical protein